MKRGGWSHSERDICENAIFSRKNDMEKDMLYSREEKDCSYAIYTYSIKNSIKKGVYFFCMDKVRWERRKYIKKKETEKLMAWTPLIFLNHIHKLCVLARLRNCVSGWKPLM